MLNSANSLALIRYLCTRNPQRFDPMATRGPRMTPLHVVHQVYIDSLALHACKESNVLYSPTSRLTAPIFHRIFFLSTQIRRPISLLQLDVITLHDVFFMEHIIVEILLLKCTARLAHFNSFCIVTSQL